MFQSNILEEFSKTFRWALEESVEILSLTFKDHVVAPIFKFSDEIIDLGQISYKFPATKTVYLTNTSDVKIKYVICVPGDERSLQNEFNITNERGKLVNSKNIKKLSNLLHDTFNNMIWFWLLILKESDKTCLQYLSKPSVWFQRLKLHLPIT